MIIGSIKEKEKEKTNEGEPTTRASEEVTCPCHWTSVLILVSILHVPSCVLSQMSTTKDKCYWLSSTYYWLGKRFALFRGYAFPVLRFIRSPRVLRKRRRRVLCCAVCWRFGAADPTRRDPLFSSVLLTRT